MKKRFVFITARRKELKNRWNMKKRRLMLCSLVSLIMVFVMAVPMTVSADAATKVAKIGDIEYATLEEAFTAASSTGGTITLLDNAENCPHVIILESGKKVTLDLNGHDVSFAKDKFIKITHGNLNITGRGRSMRVNRIWDRL